MTLRRLWIGTFPVAGIGTQGGLGEGIWRTDLDLSTGRLSPAVQVCETPAPSFLVGDASRGLLHSTGEVPRGEVSTWRVQGDCLTRIAVTTSGGVEPTHLTLMGHLLVVANYGDGTVGVLDVSGDVPRLRCTFPHTGSGPVAGRQDGPHAHSSLTLPGDEGVLVFDLGTDEVRTVWTSGDAVLEDTAHSLRLAGGSGPRHAAWREGGRLLDVTCELSGDVVTLSWDGRRAQVVGTVALPGAQLPSHIRRSSLDASIYVADRGPGVLHVLDPRPRPDDSPSPRIVGEVPAGSDCPRHFEVVPDGRRGEFLVVAGQTASRLHVLHRAPGEPLPHLLPHETEIPSPAFVLPG